MPNIFQCLLTKYPQMLLNWVSFELNNVLNVFIIWTQCIQVKRMKFITNTLQQKNIILIIFQL